MQSKKARSLSSVEAENLAHHNILESLSEEMIEAEVKRNCELGYMPFWNTTDDAQREFTLYWLVEFALFGPDEPDDSGL
jgi:hypothetical protein